LDFLERCYDKNPDFIFRKILKEFILIPIRQNVADMESIYTLDGVGAFVWDELDGQITLADIQSEILNEYEVEPSVVRQDLEDLIENLEAIGAVRRA